MRLAAQRGIVSGGSARGAGAFNGHDSKIGIGSWVLLMTATALASLMEPSGTSALARIARHLRQHKINVGEPPHG
jgi:hypothetical protein